MKFRLQKQRTAIDTKEANKTVSLGTSKVNYMDPRITVAWCKKVSWHNQRWLKPVRDSVGHNNLWLSSLAAILDAFANQ